MSQINYQHYLLETAQLEAKSKIAALTDKKDLILVTGAGFSKNFGYPLWKEFLDDLKSEYHIDLDESKFSIGDDLDYLRYTQEIYNKCEENDFKNFISETFNPSKWKNPDDEFYNTLISMGFCGFVTLNYDYTLELVIQHFKPEIRPESIDFCMKDREIPIRRFLNNAFNKENEHRYILHLHGAYTSPSKVILTQDSYERCYLNGPITELVQLLADLKEETKYQPKIFPKLCEIERRIDAMYKDKTLQSLHRKIIWILFALHHLLFIGFSTDDRFFMELLNVVKDDFMLPSIPKHYVLTHFKSKESPEDEREKEKICKKMIDRGVYPIFYPVIDSNYEKGLRDVINEINNLKKRDDVDSGELPTNGVPKVIQPSDQTIDDITFKTMRL